MLLSGILVGALIIFGVIILFMVAVILNGLTKSPENVDLPEQCSNCNCSCAIKFDKTPKTKESIIEYYKNCEANNESQQKN